MRVNMMGRKEPYGLDSSATGITTVTLVKGGAMQGYENIGSPCRNDRAGRGRKANGIGKLAINTEIHCQWGEPARWQS
jgi:hypothetical protein